MKLFPLTAAALALALPFHAALAQAQPRTDQVRIVYEDPTDDRHRIIRQLMQERRILETVASLLNAFRLPRELTLEEGGWQGRETARYDRCKATLCSQGV